MENSDKSCSIFEKYFGNLIEQGKVKIVYEYRHHFYKEDCSVAFRVVSVNDCINPYDFKKQIQKLGRRSILELKKDIESSDFSEWIDHLELIKDELDELRDLVFESSITYEENEYGPREDHYFLSFCDVKYIEANDDKREYHKRLSDSILKEADVFAKEWQNTITEIRNKTDHLLNQIELTLFQPSKRNRFFIDLERINELKSVVSTQFDLTRLIRLCEEINTAFQNEMYFSIAMLLRSLIDHVPPIFNAINFDQVVGQHGTKSFKHAMSHLNNSLRKISDSSLHTHIRKSEVLPNQTQINFSNDIDVLLAEIFRLLKS